MSKLDELIAEMCPDGVQSKKISELCCISRGIVISKEDISNNVGDYPVYSSQTENNGELGKINTYAYDGEYLTWTTDGANAGTVFYREGKFNVTNVCGLLQVINSDCMIKYLYHVLKVEAPKYVRRGMGNPKLMSNVKEFLTMAINDYNKKFKTNFGVESKEFQNYYRDLANRVKSQEVDLLIVVGMFLTGFDAPTLNTLFVDKNLRYHGLMQAFSRTNRIYDSTKTFGNIVTFRDLEQATIDAIKCFGDDNTKNIVLEKSYQEYMNGFKDIVTGEARRGYVDVVQELKSRFADVDEITTEKEKKEFVKLFGEYLKIENILQNYDEFTNLKELQKIDLADSETLEIFKSTHFVSDEDIKAMQLVDILEERTVQDYRSKYNDIREWIRREREGKEKGNSKIDWDDVVFEVDLLKSQEINLDYILELIYEKNKNTKDKNILIDEIRRIVRASTGNRAKESLIVAFINQTDLDEIQDKASIIDAFFQFAQKEQKREAEELIMEEKLNEEAAKRYILTSLRKEYASENGTDLNEILPKMSPLNPQYHTKKQSVFEKISTFVEKFKGVGGVI